MAHTWRYHRRHQTVGHVWQGRFKSPVIQGDDHGLVVLRYIEGNPFRAGIVARLEDYAWSSYRAHGLGVTDPLLAPLPAWSALGSESMRRQKCWSQLVHAPLTERELGVIRHSVTSGRPYGSPRWIEATAGILGLFVARRPRGRPRK